MSKKKPNMKTRPLSHKEQSRHELEQLLKACNVCLDVSFSSLHGLIGRYRDGDYSKRCEPEQITSIEDYIKALNTDLKDLESRLTDIATSARKKAVDYKNPENNLVLNIEIHQLFEEWTIDYQTTIVPTMLELAKYLDGLDEPTNQAETHDE